MPISSQCDEGKQWLFSCGDFLMLIDSVRQMESAVTAPVSGHVKRVVVQEGKSL